MNSDPALFLIHAQYIDGVFVTDDVASLFPTNPHLSQPHNYRSTNSSHRYFGNHLAPPNNYSVFWDPYTYGHQFNIDDSYVTTEDVNLSIAAMQNLDRNFGTRLSGQPFDYTMLHDHTQVKKRNHCADKVEEICSICLSEYVNDETIGTLHCGHEYHATCIEKWLLRGKKNCPICRSSV
uniref:RING-type E3 ubiquitin transferase n=1 Tax=Solanum lycopersicum TaxID=4081 RepID=A0A3Q7JBW2_SOLLC|nr:probable E3 ubiquitin-protein ligase RHG1A [Solanum lycopersicum]